MGLLEEQSRLGFATSDAYFLQDGVSHDTRYYAELPGGFRFEDQPYWILDSNFIFGMAVIRRELFDLHGRFDESLGDSEDWDLWIRFILGGERVASSPSHSPTTAVGPRASAETQVRSSTTLSRSSSALFIALRSARSLGLAPPSTRGDSKRWRSGTTGAADASSGQLRAIGRRPSR